MSFNKLVEDNYKTLLQIACNITGCKEKGHDLMNDTYLHLVNKALNLESGEDFVKLYRVCMKNIYLDSFKKRKVNLVNCEILEYFETDNGLINEIETFKSKLPLHERYLFEVYYEEDLSVPLIASEVGVGETYIYEIVRNISKKLKQINGNS